MRIIGRHRAPVATHRAEATRPVSLRPGARLRTRMLMDKTQGVAELMLQNTRERELVGRAERLIVNADLTVAEIREERARHVALAADRDDLEHSSRARR